MKKKLSLILITMSLVIAMWAPMVFAADLDTPIDDPVIEVGVMAMKKKLLIVIAAILLLSIAAGCSTQNSSGDDKASAVIMAILQYPNDDLYTSPEEPYIGLVERILYS